LLSPNRLRVQRPPLAPQGGAMVDIGTVLAHRPQPGSSRTVVADQAVQRAAPAGRWRACPSIAIDPASSTSAPGGSPWEAREPWIADDVEAASVAGWRG
jgi:hypothetical protein